MKSELLEKSRFFHFEKILSSTCSKPQFLTYIKTPTIFFSRKNSARTSKMTQMAYFRIIIFACDSDHAYLAQK